MRLLLIQMKVKELLTKIRKKLLTFGYTCDNCGGEIFDYPDHRFCYSCEEKMSKIKRACPKCGRETVAEGICLTCKGDMPKFTQGVAAFSYKGELAGVINRMKNGNQRLAVYLGERMADAVLPFLNEEEEMLLVPVPLTESRKKERGYNQAERLAEAVEKKLKEAGVGIRLETELLEKRRETELQKQKTRRERAENVRGAYHVHDRKGCKEKTIILVDDILTTGATGSECARLLLSAKAKKVIFLVAAALPEQK